tara:strand:+ start:264 stop:680 length:417 start_codon:yes stop_codon:yes gene_type:complete
MSKKEEIKKIQQSINDILGTKSSLSEKLLTLKDKKRESFNLAITGLAYLNSRSIGLKHDYKVDFQEYDDAFISVIESLLELHFSKEQRSIINWYLYDKFLPDGSMLILNEETSGKEIPTDTPDDIWELIQKYEEEDNK